MFEYMIVSDEYISDIETAIDDYLRQGWTLQGGVCYATRGNNQGVFCQATVRPRTERPKTELDGGW